jgi:hypothetical protein
MQRCAHGFAAHIAASPGWLAAGILHGMHAPYTVAFAALVAGGCAVHEATPTHSLADATGGHAPSGFDATAACDDWDAAVGSRDRAARSHVSFPETDPARSCFVPVRYGTRIRPDAIPAGCGYPAEAAVGRVVTQLEARAARYERIASGASGEPLPIDLACALPDDVRRVAADANARTMRALARRLPDHAPFPYAAVATFGYGRPEQGASALVPFRAGDACPVLDANELQLLDVNVTRASRAADAYFAGVAPVIVVSGGAVHSRLTEAFVLGYLLTCRFAVPATDVLLDPCADHTHTNLRNTGSFVVALGGRTAYVVTDDGLQSDYLEEWTWFDVIGGSIDRRALRDFGYLLGSHRRASVGMKAGFWYTPYRFWGDAPEGMGGLACVP